MSKVKCRDISVYYEIRGKGQPVLLIAGLASDNASWLGVARVLSEHFQVITFDNRGAGRSDTPDKKYSIRQMADDAVCLLDRLRIKRCHIVGHSMGGYIAQEMAIRYPERVDRLILEGTAPVSTERNIELFNDFLTRFLKDNDFEALMWRWAFWLFSPKTFEHKSFIPTFMKNVLKYPYAQSATGFRRQIGAATSFDARERIGAITAKTLVIVGADDILITPQESEALVRTIPGSALAVLKDTGHCIHLESPKVFIPIVLKFLKK